MSPTALRRSLRPLRRAGWRLRLERDARRARVRAPDLAIFHDFAPPPAGGAHQTLAAILGELERRGVSIELNVLPPSTRACLFNSFNFDFERLRLLARRAPDVRMVHRVGAVTSLYRGFDDGTDARVAALNRELAHATIAISHATIEMYRSIGVELVEPRVIHNGTDPEIFNPIGRVAFDRSRKTRLIAAAWSDNPRKGGPVLKWLDEHLDFDRWSLTFVGNTTERFEHVEHVRPVPPRELADLFRGSDIFVTATENDAYSNALVEALCCGLPAVYLRSGGSHEAVKEAGLGFDEPEEIPALLDRLVDEYEDRQARISLPSLADVTNEYLGVLGLDEFIDDGR